MTNVRAGHESGNLIFGRKVTMTDDLSPITEWVAQIDGPIVFFNIGTPRVNGDAFAPILGSLLVNKRVGRYGVTVMGTEKNPIHARNIDRRIESLKRRYPNHTIIATDAAAGKVVGRYTMFEGMLAAGTGVRRQLAPVGDYGLMVTTFTPTGFVEIDLMALYVKDRSAIASYASRAAEAIVAGLRKRSNTKEVAHAASNR